MTNFFASFFFISSLITENEMSPISPTEWRNSTVNCNPCEKSSAMTTYAGITGVTDEFVENYGAGDNKVEFFLSMGLEIKKYCDINYYHKNKDCDYYSSEMNAERSCRLSNRLMKLLDESSEESSIESMESKSKNATKNRFSDNIDLPKITANTRKCSVAIKGEQCKICGRCFKCITDVETHIKKNHIMKKPRKQVVLKIGDEVISKVSIRSKYLKRLDKVKNKYRNVTVSDDFTRVSNDELESRRNIEDEDVKEILRIRRPRTVSGPEIDINHETPTRTQRDLLLANALREPIIVDIDPEDKNEIVEEYCWLANDMKETGNLNVEEHNCSFPIENENIDFTNEFSNSTFDSSTYDFCVESLLYSNEAQQSDLPDFIDYTHCLDHKISFHDNNNNKKKNIDEMAEVFYNEDLIDGWSNPASFKNQTDAVLNQLSYDNNSNSSVVIKEEIILDDLS